MVLVVLALLVIALAVVTTLSRFKLIEPLVEMVHDKLTFLRSKFGAAEKGKYNPVAMGDEEDAFYLNEVND